MSLTLIIFLAAGFFVAVGLGFLFLTKKMETGMRVFWGIVAVLCCEVLFFLFSLTLTFKANISSVVSSGLGLVKNELTSVYPGIMDESLNLDQLSADVEDVINGKKTDIGITTEYFTEEPSASGVDSYQRAKVLASFSTRSTGSNVIYIRVIFDGYQQNNGAIVIESGVMILTARGTNDNTKLVLEKYSAKTVETPANTSSASLPLRVA